jgi:outer membrane protein OmpA-like peptidoglycan-associated protein
MTSQHSKIKPGNFLTWITIGTIILCICGCAPKTRVVLLPDQNGHVGQVSVASKAGEQILSAAYETTEVASSSRPPSKPRVMDKSVVKATFKEALESQPGPPIHFLLYFISGTNKLTKTSLELVPQVISTINNRRSSYISVVGHTDRLGSESYNQQLSLKRAGAVKKLLVLNGVDPKIIEITSHGENNPLVETPDGKAEPRNRRVEITVR